MLDDVLDKEAGPKPKLVTQPASVGSAIRHIPQADRTRISTASWPGRGWISAVLIWTPAMSAVPSWKTCALSKAPVRGFR